MVNAQLLRGLPALLAISLSVLPAAIAADSGPSVDAVTSGGNAVQHLGNSDVRAADKALKAGLPPQALPCLEKVRKSRTIARQLAKDEWLDRIAAAYPPIIEAICEHPDAAALVAAHPHIAQIADVDHYLCRRLTRWHHATEVLLRNPHADHVITLDPQGIYWAIERRPAYGRLLAGHAQITGMINYDPNIGRVLTEHMR